MKLMKKKNTRKTLQRLTQHVEDNGGLSQLDVVLAGRHLAAILPRVLLGDGVEGQRGAIYLRPLFVRIWDSLW